MITLEELDDRLRRIELEIGLDSHAAMEYRRSLSGMRWHWWEDCLCLLRKVEHLVRGPASLVSTSV